MKYSTDLLSRRHFLNEGNLSRYEHLIVIIWCCVNSKLLLLSAIHQFNIMWYIIPICVGSSILLVFRLFLLLCERNNSTGLLFVWLFIIFFYISALCCCLYFYHLQYASIRQKMVFYSLLLLRLSLRSIINLWIYFSSFSLYFFFFFHLVVSWCVYSRVLHRADTIF